MEEEGVFFYDEDLDIISSITKYHGDNLSVGPLVEAHPNVIYFYATLIES